MTVVQDVKRHTKCRICGSSKLEQFLSLGNTPPANSFLKKKDFSKEKHYPLRVGFCHNCNLVQLMDIVDKEKLFSNYVYFFSAMPMASKHFMDYADNVLKFVKNKKQDLIIELGSNDGLFLRCFKDRGCKNILGIDPAKNIAKYANEQGIPTIDDFFSQKLAKEILKSHGKAKVIMGNNVVAHINDHHDLMRGISEILDKDGIFVLEAPYIVDMFENLAFDSIYHEHLSYLGVKPLIHLFKRYGMDIFDVKLVERQGNSIRVYTCWSGQKKIRPSVTKLLKKENFLDLNNIRSYKILAAKISDTKNKLVKTLKDLKGKGFRIAAYGSPARGNTLLNYCGINSNVLDFATEELNSKVGFYTPGTHIPVIHINEARKRHPDYYLMLAWPYKEAIIKKEADFIKNGGRFILPTNGVKIV